jgi:hypothetical protein
VIMFIFIFMCECNRVTFDGYCIVCQKNQQITSKLTFIANKQISEVQPQGQLSTDKFQRLFRLNQWTKSMEGNCLQVSCRTLIANDFK